MAGSVRLILDNVFVDELLDVNHTMGHPVELQNMLLPVLSRAHGTQPKCTSGQMDGPQGPE